MSNKLVYFIRELIEEKRPFVVAGVMKNAGSTPRKRDAWLVMTEDGQKTGTVGGGKLEAETEAISMEMLKTKAKSRIHKFNLNNQVSGALDMVCGGEAEIHFQYIEGGEGQEFLDEISPNSTAYIFGGGHVAYALEPVLRHIDFKTVVLDDRQEYANADRFPYAEAVHVIDGYDRAFEDIETDENSYLIIVTRGHRGDYEVLKDAIRQPKVYLGMIGSRNKNRSLFELLRAEGYSEEEINSVYAPIGENIHAETPEEIAISIAAELIRVRSGHGRRLTNTLTNSSI